MRNPCFITTSFIATSLTTSLTAASRPRRAAAGMVLGLVLAVAGPGAIAAERLSEASQHLFEAVQLNDLARAQASIGEGADLEAKNNWGLTAYELAVDRGYFDIAHYLLSIRNFKAAAKDKKPEAPMSRLGTTSAPLAGMTAPPLPPPGSAAPAPTPPPAWPAGTPNPFDPDSAMPGANLPLVTPTVPTASPAKVVSAPPTPKAARPASSTRVAAPVEPDPVPAAVADLVRARQALEDRPAAPVVPETPAGDARAPDTPAPMARKVTAPVLALAPAPVPAPKMAATAGETGGAGSTPSQPVTAPKTAIAKPAPPTAPSEAAAPRPADPAPSRAAPRLAQAEDSVAEPDTEPSADFLHRVGDFLKESLSPAPEAPSSPPVPTAISSPSVSPSVSSPPVSSAAPSGDDPVGEAMQFLKRQVLPDRTPPPPEHGLPAQPVVTAPAPSGSRAAPPAEPPPVASGEKDSGPGMVGGLIDRLSGALGDDAPPEASPAAPAPTGGTMAAGGLTLAGGVGLGMPVPVAGEAGDGAPRPCIEKGAGAVVFCVLPVDWPPDLQTPFRVSTVMYKGTRAIVRYDAGRSTRLHTLFDSRSFDAVAAHFQARYGPPTAREERSIALPATPAQANPILVWRAADPASGGVAVLTVRRFDDTRGGFPDDHRGAVSLALEGAEAIFPRISALDLMLTRTR